MVAMRYNKHLITAVNYLCINVTDFNTAFMMEKNGVSLSVGVYAHVKFFIL